MAKYESLVDIGSLGNPTTARAAINANAQRIEDAFDNTLSRDGSGPNNMEADIDLDGHYLLNVADAVSDGDAVNLRQLQLLLADVQTGIDPGLRVDLSGDAGASLVKWKPADPLSLRQAISAFFDNGVPVTWYATSAQLAVDATAATQKAINWAIASGRKSVYFPGGNTYRFAEASASLDPGVNDITFYGDGWHSLIVFEEGSVGGSILDRKNLFRNTTATTKGSISFRDLQFRGTWAEAGYPTGGGGATMLLDYYDNIDIKNCKFTNLRSYVMANEFAKNAMVQGCVFDKNARDNVRFRSSFNVQVLGNRFSHSDDDAVALHSNINVTAGDMREGLVVKGNLFEDCPAVQIIGGRMVTVKDNILRRTKQNGILVYTASGVANEGDNSIFSIDVSGNQIYDMLADSPFSAAVSQAIGVYSRAAEGGSSTGSVIPGAPLAATGVFVLPWTARNTAYTGTVDSVAPPYNIRVQDNIIARTLPAVATYSLWGYGSTYAGDGPQNPAVTDTALRPSNGIILGGQIRKAIVSGNIISHTVNALAFDQEAGSNFGMDHVLMQGNVLSDFSTNALNIPNPGAVRHVSVEFIDNEVDGDPLHISTNRKTAGTTDGSWLADGAPQVISNTSHQGVRVERNRIKNVCRIVNNGGGSLISLRDNVLRGDPIAVGFSTSNKGIGNVPRADGAYRWEVVDSDPTSATYGNITSAILPYSAAMPAAGRYVQGTFVQASNSTTLYGWLRLTTGTAHVAGTDWKTVVLT